MNSRKTKRQKARNSANPPATTTAVATNPAESHHSNKALRETVESVVIAFVLAFLFRAFEAEAFVIPTGSMAPTLQGRHKDVFCPECGFNYRASASQENPDNENRIKVRSCVCPSCGYLQKVADETSYNGDRILVSKFAYELREPERWDVIVFRYPGNAKMNYIKRLVGLPNEIIRIAYGDIFRAPNNSAENTSPQFTILRKTPDKLRAMLHLIHDNRYLSQNLIRAGWPERWQTDSQNSESGTGVWQSQITSHSSHSSQGKQTWTIDGSNTDQTRWIRYRHFIPEHWQQVPPHGSLVVPDRPSLIHDSYAYNMSGPPVNSSYRVGPFNWVGDLALECNVTVQSNEGELILELIEGGVTFHCQFDISTGTATLSIDQGQVSFDSNKDDNFLPKAKTSVNGPGTYRLMLTNVDDQLVLWVNGKHVPFAMDTTYPRLQNVVSTAQDRSPAAVGTRGATLQINRLKIFRDVYYIASHNVISSGRYHAGHMDTSESVEFEMKGQQYFVLGDNSPASKDSRLWSVNRPGESRVEHYVDRDLLIGKALFIYWPHARSDIFPFCPNIPQMGFVR